MARRRVFKTRADCPGINASFVLTSNKLAFIDLDGRSRLKSQRRIPEPLYASMYELLLWGILTLGLGIRWPLAIDRGQSFTAIIINAYPIYNDNFEPTSAHLDLKVEYLLEKNQPAIEAPTVWRAVRYLQVGLHRWRGRFSRKSLE